MPDYRHALSAFLKDAGAAGHDAGAGTATSPGVELGVDPNLRHLNMRLDAADDSLMSDLAESLGQQIPMSSNTFSSGEHTVYWLGPDEWQVTTTADPQPLIRRLRNVAGDRFATFVDVSDGLVSLHLSGGRVHDMLAKGCTLDLHPDRFRPGDCAQTTLAKASMLIAARNAQGAFDIVIRRSFAEYTSVWLRHASAEFGFRAVLA